MRARIMRGCLMLMLNRLRRQRRCGESWRNFDVLSRSKRGCRYGPDWDALYMPVVCEPMG